MSNGGTGDRLRVSFLDLRRVVGILAVTLPLLLALWGFAICGCVGIEDSLSDYYHLRTGDLFVGILFGIALFLFAYRGYERRDDIAGDVAGVFALGVALFSNEGPDWETAVHLVSAVGLFATLAYFSWFLFTKSAPSPSSPSPQKLIRNRIYRVCALLMVFWLTLAAVYYFFLQDTAVADVNPIFWLESLLLWTFGVAWFIKGKTLWRDA
ncbi:MAG: DUF998 domain-containing protein [Chloroflexi bacterium]|nr:DUF998 domain-containing protein [Chloroflexota bacterium]MCI0779264.1 DUF998 domain-containing protein [Chloroflexota bacterium]MCI0816309.1 DUF998 domain-containing protein [Chloroflexota bacterium]MCI0888892.1 DUF998 domain-containing protein [Chloroflexota bacterium]